MGTPTASPHNMEVACLGLVALAVRFGPEGGLSALRHHAAAGLVATALVCVATIFTAPRSPSDTEFLISFTLAVYVGAEFLYGVLHRHAHFNVAVAVQCAALLGIVFGYALLANAAMAVVVSCALAAKCYDWKAVSTSEV